MKIMKKFLAVLLVLTVTVPLSACDEKKPKR